MIFGLGREVAKIIFLKKTEFFIIKSQRHLILQARGVGAKICAPRFYFILLKLCAPLGSPPRRIKWHKKSQRERATIFALALWI